MAGSGRHRQQAASALAYLMNLNRVQAAQAAAAPAATSRNIADWGAAVAAAGVTAGAAAKTTAAAGARPLGPVVGDRLGLLIAPGCWTVSQRGERKLRSRGAGSTGR